MFGTLKGYMRDQHYKIDESAQQTVNTLSQNTKMGFYCIGIFKLMQHRQKCRDYSEDFME
jgi:hypothetical protein